MIEIIKMLLQGATLHPTIARHVLAIKKKVYTPLAALHVQAYPSAEPMEKEQLTLLAPVDVKKGYRWATERFGACWFRLTGTVPPEGAGRHLVVLMKIRGEGVSYDDEGNTGDIITSIMSVPDVLQPPTIGKCVLDVASDAQAGAPIDMWVDAGYNGINGNFLFRSRFCYADLAVCNEDVSAYYYDYLTLALLLATDKTNTRLTSALQEQLLAALSKSYRCFAKGDLAAAKEALQGYYALPYAEQGVQYTMVGHAHLDLAWLWPERESKRKAVRTLTNAVRQIERCPRYVFGMSQAQMIDWVRQSTPTLFAKLQQYVATGNIEIQGGMWVESDCNMPSGESLIRQFAYGDRFFLQHFGTTSKTVWLPDAFGFPSTLPQIIKGVGKDYFATIKLYWNRVNKFPYQSFYWQAPDGSRVLVHLAPEKTYCNDGTPLAVAKSEKYNIQKETGHALVIYGVGDGGGGPGEGHVQVAARIGALAGCAPTRMGSAQGFFEALQQVDGLPVYDGELYLEYHRGTYTSQASNKQGNRFAERELHALEWLLAVYGKDGACVDECWKTLLLTQFHDILPGSGIGRVHRESVQQLQQIIQDAHDMQYALLQGEDGLSALNPSPFARREYVQRNNKTYLAEAQGYASATLIASEYHATASSNALENEKVKIVFENGAIVSYLDKIRGKEYSAGGLNVLRLYRDKDKRYDAWNMDPDYMRHPRALRYAGAQSYVEGADAVMELRFATANSTIVQKVRLAESTQVVFDTYVDWHEAHLTLRADFEPAVYADSVQCDIQFGSVQRSTRNQTDIERAQFEVCAHKYVAVNDGDDWFAVYNDSKYGHRCKDGVLSLTLLRSPKYPDPDCDMGEHHFTYAMDIPHGGRELVARAYNFNAPLLVVDKAVRIAPLVTVDCDNIVVETIKPAQNRKGFAVRMYERFGQEADCNLHIQGGSVALWQCDLLENNECPLVGTLHFSPHQIRTVVVER